MLTLSDLSRLKGFRFPRSVIGYAVWAYHRFALSLRDVEDLMASHGITVSYETIRDWVARFGVQFAARIRRDRPGAAQKWHVDEVIVTDKLRSYGAAKAELAPGIEHRQHKGLNNRAEASHRHTRWREKPPLIVCRAKTTAGQCMGRFKSPGQAQRFLSAHDQTAALFRPKRHRLSAISFRHARSDAFDLWTTYAHELIA